MSNWPIGYPLLGDAIGVSTAASVGTSLGTGYTELISSTVNDYEGFYVSCVRSNTASAMASIGFGAAGVEYTVLSDILIPPGTQTSLNHTGFYMPIQCNSGVRIAGLATATVIMALQGIRKGWFNPGFSLATTYGSTGAQGTTLDPGATINTKGAWAQLTASTTRAHKAIMILVGNNNNTTKTTGGYLIDVGAGAAGAEYTFLPNLYASVHAAPDIIGPRVFGPFPCDIPAGTRLAMRCQASISTASNRLIDAVIYGYS